MTYEIFDKYNPSLLGFHALGVETSVLYYLTHRWQGRVTDLYLFQGYFRENERGELGQNLNSA